MAKLVRNYGPPDNNIKNKYFAFQFCGTTDTTHNKLERGCKDVRARFSPFENGIKLLFSPLNFFAYFVLHRNNYMCPAVMRAARSHNQNTTTLKCQYRQMWASLAWLHHSSHTICMWGFAFNVDFWSRDDPRHSKGRHGFGATTKRPLNVEVKDI